jgi:hypothetical protein
MSNELICPGFAAFRAGRVTLGLLMVAMQLSIVFWPVAVRWARGLGHECRVQVLLDQISVNYAYQPCEKYGHATKAFSGASASEGIA